MNNTLWPSGHIYIYILGVPLFSPKKILGLTIAQYSIMYASKIIYILIIFSNINLQCTDKVIKGKSMMYIFY